MLSRLTNSWFFVRRNERWNSKQGFEVSLDEQGYLRCLTCCIAIGMGTKNLSPTTRNQLRKIWKKREKELLEKKKRGENVDEELRQGLLGMWRERTNDVDD